MSADVLIVEDEILLAMDIERVLQQAGFRVVGLAADSREALALAAKARVALIDLHLRDGLTGPKLARELAERHALPIIYVTANPSQIRERATTTVGVVTKPFSDTALLAAVKNAVGHSGGAGGRAT
jgi:two-component system, response regulator PdtaR